MFPTLSHPLSIGLVILWSTVCIALIAGFNFSSLWLSYTLVLVILGALLVIFIYVSLLSSNEIFISPKSYSVALNLGLAFVISFLVYSQDSNTSTYYHEIAGVSSIESSGMDRLSMLYSQDLSLLTIFLICYLLVTLIVVVFITQDNKSTLRAAQS